jgi:hypothetical protein
MLTLIFITIHIKLLKPLAMKNKYLFTLLLSALLVGPVFGNNLPIFINGTPDIKTINALAFSPEGVLFIGDAQSAKVFAIITDDSKAGDKVENISVTAVDNKIAQLLGMAIEDFTITDMAVNPISKNLFFSIQHNSGKSTILKYADGKFSTVSLENINYSSASLINAIGEDAKDRRGRSQRRWAISDMSFYDGKVLLTGLSNEEFGSTFRSIPFPFKDEQAHSSLEIYHAAHGRYETNSPIKTFTATTIDNEPYLIASYTCTPLVLFSLKDLKSGEHVKGRTVAELGSNNTPYDMITMEKDGEKYLLIANSSRALMKVKFADIEAFKSSLTTPVEETSVTAGVYFVALPFVNVLQLDALDDSRFIMLQRKSNGSLDVVTQTERWL